MQSYLFRHHQPSALESSSLSAVKRRAEAAHAGVRSFWLDLGLRFRARVTRKSVSSNSPYNLIGLDGNMQCRLSQVNLRNTLANKTLKKVDRIFLAISSFTKPLQIFYSHLEDAVFRRRGASFSSTSCSWARLDSVQVLRQVLTQGWSPPALDTSPVLPHAG